MMSRIRNGQTFKRLFVLSQHLKKVKANYLSTTTNAPHIELSSNFALIDEKVQIKAHGLGGGQKVTLQAYLEESGKPFGACGHYIADSHGKLDTFMDPSHGGTFKGVEPMGLFWSLKSTPGVKPSQLLKVDHMAPYQVTIALQDGFQEFEDLQWTHELYSLAFCDLQRSYAAPGVRSFPVHENGLHGVLLVPPGDGPFPAVIDVFGLGGGIRGFRGALLASHGIAAFSLSYVTYEDLPKSEMDLDFTYFLRAFDWLASHPLIDSSALGGVSTCVGSGYVQFIASRRPAMKCLAIINGCGVPIGREQTVEGEAAVVSQFSFDRVKMVDGMAAFKYMFSLSESDKLNYCPSWRHGAKHLWICGLDDQCVNPDILHAFKSTIPSEFQENYTFVTYPGAGHLLEPPYSPLWRSTYMPIFKNHLLWGGQPELHAKAQEDSWPKIIEFLYANLRTSKSKLQVA